MSTGSHASAQSSPGPAQPLPELQAQEYPPATLAQLACGSQGAGTVVHSLRSSQLPAAAPVRT